MIQHKLTYRAVIIGTILVFGSCSKWLDLKPESEMILDNYWQKESDATSVVAGCYKALTGDDCMSRMILWGEGRSDNVGLYISDDEDFKKLLRFDLSPTNKYCTMGPFYTVINYCNTFLYYAPGVMKVDPNFTEADLHQLEAEVLTIRALTYFYLLRSFQNVPWVNKPSINDQQNFNIGQSTERDVIDSLVSNLQTALRYAPTTYGDRDSNKGRITKNAVMSLLADIYLWDMQYAKSIEMCDKIMLDINLQLLAGSSVLYNVFYLKNSPESIFELQFGETNTNESKQFNNMVKKYYGSFEDPTVALAFSSFLASGTKSPFNLIVGTSTESENDVRIKDDVNLNLGQIEGIYPIFKYAGNSRYETMSGQSSIYMYRTNSANWIIYRLSDIMLMKAEALVQLNRSKNDLQGALNLVNTVYLRSNYSATSDSLQFSSYQTKDNFEKLVLRERQREFLFEGKRWFDLMRRARRINSVVPALEFVSEKLTGNSGNQINSNSIIDALYLPINQGELNANPSLKQNPYYDLSASK